MEDDDNKAEKIDINLLMKEIFDYYDFDRDGYITLKEFSLAMKAKGIISTEKELEYLFYHCKKENPNKMSFKEFLTFSGHKVSLLNNKEEIIETLKIFDNQGTGFIKLSDFKYLLLNLGEEISEEELDYYLSNISTNEKGLCSIKDLSDVLSAL